MRLQVRSGGLLAVLFVTGFATAYTLKRTARADHRRDMLDAVTAVQRRSPRFLISEPLPSSVWSDNWAQYGVVYLCRSPRTPEDVDRIGSVRDTNDARWEGIICFKGIRNPRDAHTPWRSDNDRGLKYGGFVVFGDAGMLQEVRDILAREGFKQFHDP